MPPAAPVRSPVLAWGALGVVYVLWGSTYPADRSHHHRRAAAVRERDPVPGRGVAAGLVVLPAPATPSAPATVRIVVGGVILMVAGAAVGGRPDLTAVVPSAWWAWAYMAVVVSTAAFSAYAFVLAALPVSTVATYAYVNPAIAVLLGVLVAKERFSAAQLAGGAVVLLAVVLVVASEQPGNGRRKRRGELAASPP